MDISSKILPRQISSTTRPNVARGRDNSATKFSSASQGTSEGVGQPQQTFAVSALDSVFLNYNEKGKGTQLAINYADQVLDELENLHRMLLTQTVSPELLHRLNEILQQRPLGDLPPELDEIVSEIQIRAAVELAKLNKL